MKCIPVDMKFKNAFAVKVSFSFFSDGIYHDAYNININFDLMIEQLISNKYGFKRFDGSSVGIFVNTIYILQN